MIKPYELRLGNAVMYMGEVKQVNYKILQRLTTTTPESNTAFQPIPITKEALKEMGFSDEDPEYKKLLLTPDATTHHLVIEDTFGKFDLPLNVFVHSAAYSDKLTEQFVYLKPVRYIHQLQNLHFAICGEELQY